MMASPGVGEPRGTKHSRIAPLCVPAIAGMIAANNARDLAFRTGGANL